ncbi:hypothetical protein ACYY4Z_26845 (plasmid) [Escherichia coli]
MKDPKKGSINGSYDLNSSGFEKGDTARRSRTTECSELVSEEAEQHRDNIRQLRAVVKKSEHIVFFMCGCLGSE